MGADDMGVVETVGLLRQVTAGIVTSTGLDEALCRLADLTVDLAPGPAWCGIALLRDGAPGLVAGSERLPTALEEEQYRRGDGPCMTAVSERDVVTCPDLTREQRWPWWCRLAVSHGVHAVVSYPLDIDVDMCGSLNLYLTDGATLTPTTHLTALLVAEQAGLLLGAVLDRSRDRERIERLSAGTDRGRSDVDRAVGILMAQRGCDQYQALEVLREAADAVGSDLPAVAAKLVSTVAARAHRHR
jgi:hypothetical protein